VIDDDSRNSRQALRSEFVLIRVHSWLWAVVVVQFVRIARMTGCRSSKFQAPSSREAPNLKLQIHARTRFEIWCLGFLWSLVLGIWSFKKHLSQAGVHSKCTITWAVLDFAACFATFNP
jgi:hypothetical protein